MKDKLKCKADDYIDINDYMIDRLDGTDIRLAFTSEWMPDAFIDWWNLRGRKSFLKYGNNHAHEYL